MLQSLQGRFDKRVPIELVKYKLDLVGVQEVRQDEDGSEPMDNYMFFMEMRMLIITSGQAFSYIIKSDQQLRGQSFLVIGWHIY
jgi:hypothetical protein